MYNYQVLGEGTYYECHVTIEKPKNKELIKFFEDIGKDLGWKTSFIDGDPVLGKKVYFYYTCHDIELPKIRNKMNHLCTFLGPDLWIRKKIEQILEDERRID